MSRKEWIKFLKELKITLIIIYHPLLMKLKKFQEENEQMAGFIFELSAVIAELLDQKIDELINKIDAFIRSIHMPTDKDFRFLKTWLGNQILKRYKNNTFVPIVKEYRDRCVNRREQNTYIVEYAERKKVKTAMITDELYINFCKGLKIPRYYRITKTKFISMVDKFYSKFIKK